jgi:molybdenum cofactor synthesis domain-containing protein
MELCIGVLSVSDRAFRGEYEDRGGPAIERALQSPDWVVQRRAIVPDEASHIAHRLTQWADEDQLDVIFTTGGTGLGARDVTPEATSSIADRLVPGIGETIRAVSLQSTAYAMLSRGVAVIRGQTLIINLAGSPKGAAEGVEIVRPILEHAVSTMRGAGH